MGLRSCGLALMATLAALAALVGLCFWFADSLDLLAYRCFKTLDSHIKERCGGEDRPRFFDAADFPLIADFEAHLEGIQAEFDAVYADVRVPQFDEVVPGQAFLNTDRRWKSFQLRVYNRDFEFNQKLCPLTSRLVRKYSDIISFAMFSVVEGPKDIPPHVGLYSGVLRVHVGLRVPPGCAGTTSGRPHCYIRIANETATWSEGRGMIFDDSLWHEVHMGVPAVRGVLFLDVRRPLDQWWLSLANRVFLWCSRFIPVLDGIEARARWYTEGGRGRLVQVGEPMQDEL